MRKTAAPSHSASRQLASRELLRIDGEFVPVTLKHNPRARRLIVKVHPSTGEITVVAPSRRALGHALDFARGESDWIAKKLAHVPAPIPLALDQLILFRGEEHIIRKGESGSAPVWTGLEGARPAIFVGGRSEHAPRRILDFLKREARKALEERTFAHAAKLEVSPKRITVRDTASRWGSCSSTKLLSYSWRLILAPDFVLDYVVAHEVAHLREMNHGMRFWRLVRELVDDVKSPQAWLSRNGILLHSYAPRVAG
ncbi:MAG: M48 family metallopeptidase [Proteobacteria bacterium]|nr:M48 family metallopeptidase [Pseudomonadota bacterium]